MKSGFGSSLLCLAFPLKVLGMVACRSMGIWGLSLTPFIRASWQTCQRKFQFSATFGFLIPVSWGEREHVYVNEET